MLVLGNNREEIAWDPWEIEERHLAEHRDTHGAEPRAGDGARRAPLSIPLPHWHKNTSARTAPFLIYPARVLGGDSARFGSLFCKDVGHPFLSS